MEKILSENKTHITLHGKEGYLYLNNDCNQEILQHYGDNWKTDAKYIDYINDNNNKYSNYLFMVFPDKSIIYPEYLPFGTRRHKRPSVNLLKNRRVKFVDLYNHCIANKSKMQVYAKTDTHITHEYGLSVVKYILNNIDPTIKTDLDIRFDEIDFSGDLTSPLNNGVRPFTSEKYKKLVSNISFSCSYCDTNINDITIDNYWDPKVDRRNVLVKLKNNNPQNGHKILIFGTSFSYIIKDIFVLFVSEVYFIYNKVDDELVNKIKPTYIIDERVERFLQTFY